MPFESCGSTRRRPSRCTWCAIGGASHRALEDGSACPLGMGPGQAYDSPALAREVRRSAGGLGQSGNAMPVNRERVQYRIRERRHLAVTSRRNRSPPTRPEDKMTSPARAFHRRKRLIGASRSSARSEVGAGDLLAREPCSVMAFFCPRCSLRARSTSLCRCPQTLNESADAPKRSKGPPPNSSHWL